MHSLRANPKHLWHTKTSLSNVIRMLWLQQFIFLFQMSPCIVSPYANTNISQTISVTLVPCFANPSLFYRKCHFIIPLSPTNYSSVWNESLKKEAQYYFVQKRHVKGITLLHLREVISISTRRGVWYVSIHSHRHSLGETTWEKNQQHMNWILLKDEGLTHMWYRSNEKIMVEMGTKLHQQAQLLLTAFQGCLKDLLWNFSQ